MNKSAQPPRRRGLRRRGASAPNGSETSSGRALRPAAQLPPRRLLRTLLLVSPLAVAIVVAAVAGLVAKDALRQPGEQQLLEGNSLLASQQLDAVFRQLLSRIPQNRPLQPADRALLET